FRQDSRFRKVRPGRPLDADTYALITHWESPWEPRVDLPQQLLDTGLIWYWQTFPGPIHSPLQELTTANAPVMVEDLRAYVEGRHHTTFGFTIYGCLAPVSLRIPEDETRFLWGLEGPIRVWILQHGDWQSDLLLVAPDVLPRIRNMLE